MSDFATESTAVKRKKRKREKVLNSETEENLLNNHNPVKRKAKTTQREEGTMDDTLYHNQTVGNMSSFNPTLSSSTPIVRHKKKKKSDRAQHDSEVNLKESSFLDHLAGNAEDDPMVRDIENKIRSQNRMETNTAQDPKELLASFFSHSKQVDMNCKLKFKRKDVHLLSIPKCIDPTSLLDVNIKLDAPSKFKIDGQKYIFEPTEITPPASLVVGSNCKIIQPKSSIFIKKYIKLVKLPELPLPEKKAVPLPDNLKKRHPLFGADFEEKINLSEEVERKLNDAIESFMRREEKMERKKSKKKKQKTLESEQPNEVIFDLLNAHQTRNSSDKEDSAYSSTGSKSVKGVNIKQELMTEYETDYEGVLKKKKKKRKIVNDDKEESMRSEKNKKKVESVNDSDQRAMNEILRNIKKEISLETPSTSKVVNRHDDDSLAKHKKTKNNV